MRCRNRVFPAALVLLFFCVGFTRAVEVHAGIKLSVNGAIGTGKGFWDWYGAEADSQRILVPGTAGAVLLQLDCGRNWALESGVGYFGNRCLLKVDGEEFYYDQPSWEIPLSLKLYLSENRIRTYLKFGPTAVILSDQASFENSDSSMRLIKDPTPGAPFHTGFNGGLGLEYRNRTGIWLLDLQYASFYSSPEYARSDGSTGDIRFHRFDLGIGYMF